MYKVVIVLILVINLHANGSGAICNKILQKDIAQPSENNSPANRLANRDDDKLDIRSSIQAPISARDANISDQFYQETADDIMSAIEKDNLRLEYHKYLILSHLGMTTPEPANMSRADKQLRQKLASDYTNTALGDGLTTGQQQQLQSDIGKLTSSSSSRHSRTKRSLPCQEVRNNKDICCLETFYVNFTDIGWDKWILYPSGYNANYCHGKCDLSHARYYHSTLLSKFSNLIGLCCAPRQMAPLHLLYIDDKNKVHQKVMPDMIVESCDCA